MLNLVVSNPISNPRYLFGTVFFTICFMVFKWKKGSFINAMLSMLVLVLIVFPYADIFRNSTNAKMDIQNTTEQLVSNGDYDAFQQLLNTVKYVDLKGIENGKQLLGAILFWVPRALWVEKPDGSGKMVGEYLGYKFTNLSCPLWAEGYINFGFIGVISFFFFLGYLTNILEQKFIFSGKSRNFTFSLVWVPFLAAYQLFLLRGDLLNGIAYMSAFILFSIVYIKIGQKREKVKLLKIQALRGIE
ncbi:hypothetical protein LCY76_20825 [Fictibacillus sp. KIGAM418]|uniref:O-antigen polysaccharide polymerase Wzy n=1 Tax=Fictibacillus marinisediminis TaxID=2878389 RepID=A0A9X1XK31_9BACL|nr:hypothetical protein [Fictibacillus marinisediminis]MCK6259019.1 hypothetical protein [Fictibacillus marinisediminis]